MKLFYESTKTLGEGSFGVVREVPFAGTQVACKKISNADQKDIEEEAGYLKLATNISTSSSKDLSPPFLKFYACYYDPLKYKAFIITEILQSSMDKFDSKFDFVQLHPKESQRLKQYKNIFEGLQKLHEQNLVHSDGKTENLMMDLKGNLKIIDLGMVHKVGSIYQGGTLDFSNPSKINGYLQCNTEFYTETECKQTQQYLDQFPFPSSITLAASPRDDIYGYGLSILFLELFIPEDSTEPLDLCFTAINKDGFCVQEVQKLVQSYVPDYSATWDVLKDIFDLDPAKNSDIGVFIGRFDAEIKRLEEGEELGNYIERVTLHLNDYEAPEEEEIQTHVFQGSVVPSEESDESEENSGGEDDSLEF